jgi:hypothetical protein
MFRATPHVLDLLLFVPYLFCSPVTRLPKGDDQYPLMYVDVMYQRPFFGDLRAQEQKEMRIFKSIFVFVIGTMRSDKVERKSSRERMDAPARNLEVGDLQESLAFEIKMLGNLISLSPF